MIKGVLENFAKFTGKHLWLAKFSKTTFLLNTSGRLRLLLAFQKQPLGVFYEKGVLANFRKFKGKHFWFAKFQIRFFTEHLWTTASGFFVQLH